MATKQVDTQEGAGRYDFSRCEWCVLAVLAAASLVGGTTFAWSVTEGMPHEARLIGVVLAGAAGLGLSAYLAPLVTIALKWIVVAGAFAALIRFAS